MKLNTEDQEQEKLIQKFYDEVPYPGNPFPQSHINRMAGMALLHGIQTPSVENCRVLELGCSDGGNLIPMAVEFPNSEFVGIDLSPKQIDMGKKTLSRLQLSNIQLLPLSILDVTEELGQFDYILTHGVFSWVPASVREKIFSICQNHLSPNGIAYISYNTYPGWTVMGTFRDMMKYRGRKTEDLKERASEAIEFFNFLADALEEDSGHFGSMVKWMKQLLGRSNSSLTYFIHEYLEEVNQPLYFHEFVGQASEHGLQYLSEADPTFMKFDDFSEKVAKKIGELGEDLIEREQYMDFIRNRTFRQTLLCRNDLPVQRLLDPSLIYQFQLGSPLQPTSEKTQILGGQSEEFRVPAGGNITSSDEIIKAAMVCLHELWPKMVSFDELLERSLAKMGNEGVTVIKTSDLQENRNRLMEILFEIHYSGLLQLRVSPSVHQTEISEYPTASPLARWQAFQEEMLVTNLFHERYALKDDLMRKILVFLDGNHDFKGIVAELLILVEKGELTILDEGRIFQSQQRLQKALEKVLLQYLEEIARAPLLMR